MYSGWFRLRSFKTVAQWRWKDRSQKAGLCKAKPQRKGAPQPFVAVHHPDVTLSGQFSEYFPTCHDQFDGLRLSPKRGVAPGPTPPRWAPHSNPKGRMPSLKVADSSFNLEIQYVFDPPVTLPLAGYVACI